MNILDKFNYLIEKKRCTLLGVGPMSKNVVDAAVELSDKYKLPIILIASRRQIDSTDFGGGYVENWTTDEFSKYVNKKSRTKNIILARDHGGPWQNSAEVKKKLNLVQAMESAKKSFKADIDNNFKILHIDPSIDIFKKISQNEILKRVFELYEYCYSYANSLNREIIFEIGTEEQSGSTNSDYELEYVIQKMNEFCKKKKLPKVSFVVVQAGTKVMEQKNVGSFESHLRVKDEIPVEIQLPRMLDICNKNNVYMKEHNTDYLSDDSLSWHPRLGIHSANVAPEFGVCETKTLLKLFDQEKLKNEKMEFLKISYNSRKWEKWMLPNSKTNKTDKSIIAGHYVFSNARVVELKNILNKKLSKKKLDLNSLLKKEISLVIIKYLKCFRLI